MVNGLHQLGREALAGEFQGGTVYLLSADLADGADETELNNKSEANATTVDGDWTISSDNAAGTTTLENSAEIDFGSPSGFTIDAIVIQSTDNVDHFVADDAPTGDTDLSGDGTFTLPAGNLTFTFGAD